MRMNTSQIFLKNSLALPFTLSIAVAVLLAVASLAGLIFPGAIYPTEELRGAFLANDVVNLFVGLPILLGSMWHARRGSLLGLLFWPGALFYIAYNSVAYAVAMPLTLSFVLNLALVLVSVYATYLILSGIDGEAVREHLQGKVPERFIGGVLVGFGALFFLMAAAKVIGFASGQADTPWSEIAVQIADLLVTPAWVVSGILLWRKRALGYISGAGLLFQASMLFVGLLVFFILQPLVADVPFPMEDFIVIAVMSLICFIPLGLFLRGVLAGKRQ